MNTKSAEEPGTITPRGADSQDDQSQNEANGKPETELAPLKERLKEDLFRVRRNTFALGVAHLKDIAEATGFPMSKVQELWSISPGFCWLDESLGYGIQRMKQPNFLFNHVQKVLSVTPLCALDELGTGLAKTKMLKKRLLPPSVLEAFCREMGLEVKKGVVSSPIRLVPEEILPAVERGLYAVLRDNGGIAHHSQFERYFQEKGLGARTYEQIASRSPIVLKLEHRLWRQTGILPSDGQTSELKRLMGPIPPPNDVSDRVEIVGHEIVVLIPISQRNREKGTGHIPQNWRADLQGGYSLFHEGAHLADLRVNGSEAYGLTNLHRLVGPGASAIRIAFNTKTRSARLVD